MPTPHRFDFWRTPFAAFLWVAFALVSIPSQGQNLSHNAAAGPVQALHVRLELISPSATVQPGGAIPVGLHFSLDKGWHVYWVNAGDSGNPPQIRCKLPAGVTVSSMQFPAPSRLPLGPLMDYGYEDEVLFPMELHASSRLHSRHMLKIPAHVDWLVCREVCIPGKANLVLPLTISKKTATPNPRVKALFDLWHSRLPKPLPPSWSATFATTPTGFVLTVMGEPGKSAEFFPLDPGQINNAAPQTVRSLIKGVQVSLKKDENFSSTLDRLNGVLRLGSSEAYTIQALPGPVVMGPDATDLGAGSGANSGIIGFLRIALLAFAGGVILNLMPCVFPVLFIKGLALVESSGEERSRMRAHGIYYALGVLVSFWIVAGVLLALRAGGHRLGWGFQFQSPAFIVIVALLLFFLGLSLAGQFEIGLTLTSTGSGLANRSGYAGSFFTGVLATVVATPCTAPFMGLAVGFALSQSAAIALTIFTSLALGLACPYLLLTLNPAWTRLLPRPGPWMQTLKQITAAPVFVTVVWLVWLLVQSEGTGALPGLIAAFLLLSVAGWVLGHWPARRAAFLGALAIIGFAVAVPLFFLQVTPAEEAGVTHTGSPQTGAPGPWKTFSQASLQRYRAQGRTVFVDFTASWCLSCQVNERVVLDRADVQKRLRDSGVVLLRADWTHHNEVIARTLSRLGRSGVPTYVLYAPGVRPKILPEVLTPGIIFEMLDKLNPRMESEAALPAKIRSQR
jgi:thiol:disulfide interchange protein DsbD